MRILLLVCFLLGEIHADGRASEATEIKSKAETALLEGHEKLIDAYRIQLAAAVAKADRVEVFQLDDRVTGNEKIGDPNDPFSGQSKDKWFRVDVPETPTTKIAVKLIVPQEKLGPLILTTSPNSGAKEDLITKRAVEFAETDLESASLAESSAPIPEQRGKKTKGNSTAIQSGSQKKPERRWNNLARKTWESESPFWWIMKLSWPRPFRQSWGGI
jgi:hypothetical protein